QISPDERSTKHEKHEPHRRSSVNADRCQVAARRRICYRRLYGTPYIVTAATRPRDIAEDLADFTATTRVLALSAAAIGIGVVSAYVAKALLTLIGLFTNLFFFQRVSTALVTPAGHSLGPLVILVPVAGALIVGVMARYGSERIRGHGIPE